MANEKTDKPKKPRPKKISMVEIEAAPARPKNPLNVRMGNRPARVDADLTEKICASIRQGNYFETAVNFQGISASVAREWLKKGLASLKGLQHEDLNCEHFFTEVRKAEAFAEAHDVKIITKAAMDGHWQASAWRLERKHPDRWGKRLQVEGNLTHSSPEGGPVEVTQLTPDERKKRLAELKKKQAEASAFKP